VASDDAAAALEGSGSGSGCAFSRSLKFLSSLPPPPRSGALRPSPAAVFVLMAAIGAAVPAGDGDAAAAAPVGGVSSSWV
jgi:hypothetical protein